MPAFTSHIFICGNRRPEGSPRGCCNPDGTDALRDAFKTELKSRGLGPLVRANAAGCLEQCELGPTVVIYPQGIWYGRVQLTDVARIIDETIIGGRILDDLLIPPALLNNRPAATIAAASKQPGQPFDTPPQ
jgi:(2Fe-2S) ferredoxin